LRGEERKGVTLNLPQFDGHFKKDTIEVEGVSNEKKNTVQQRIQAGGHPTA
jgi:hypothetical protein